MISQCDTEEAGNGREPAARPVGGVRRSDRSSWTARREAPLGHRASCDMDLAGNHDTATQAKVQVPEAAPGSRGPPAARAGRAAAGVLLGYY
jgi:hypothetical protein